MVRRRRVDDERLLRLAQLRLGMRLAREDLSVLAQRLDDCPPWLDGEAADEWKQAAGLYAEGRAALRGATGLADVLRVHTVLREAWFHLARSDAFAFDEIPPTSSEPCWFDPQHGPATDDLDWPSVGPVRVCRDDADRVAAGLAPRVRRRGLLELTDQTGTSPVQRHLEAHARGAGGYAMGALYAGPPAGTPL